MQPSDPRTSSIVPEVAGDARASRLDTFLRLDNYGTEEGDIDPTRIGCSVRVERSKQSVSLCGAPDLWSSRRPPKARHYSCTVAYSSPSEDVPGLQALGEGAASWLSDGWSVNVLSIDTHGCRHRSFGLNAERQGILRSVLVATSDRLSSSVGAVSALSGPDRHDSSRGFHGHQVGLACFQLRGSIRRDLLWPDLAVDGRALLASTNQDSIGHGDRKSKAGRKRDKTVNSTDVGFNDAKILSGQTHPAVAEAADPSVLRVATAQVRTVEDACLLLRRAACRARYLAPERCLDPGAPPPTAPVAAGEGGAELGAGSSMPSPPGWHTVVRLVLRSEADGCVRVLHAVDIAGSPRVHEAGRKGAPRTDGSGSGGLPDAVGRDLRADAMAVERMLAEAAATERSVGPKGGEGGAAGLRSAEGAAGVAAATRARVLPQSGERCLLGRVVGSLLFGNAKTFLHMSIPSTPQSYLGASHSLGLASTARSVVAACIRRRGIPSAAMGLQDPDWGRIDREEGLQHRDELMSGGDAAVASAWKLMRGRGKAGFLGAGESSRFRGGAFGSGKRAPSPGSDLEPQPQPCSALRGQLRGKGADAVEGEVLGRGARDGGAMQGQTSGGVASAVAAAPTVRLAAGAAAAARQEMRRRIDRMDLHRRDMPGDDGKTGGAGGGAVSSTRSGASGDGSPPLDGLRWFLPGSQVETIAKGGWRPEHTRQLDHLVERLQLSLQAGGAERGRAPPARVGDVSRKSKLAEAEIAPGREEGIVGVQSAGLHTASPGGLHTDSPAATGSDAPPQAECQSLIGVDEVDQPSVLPGPEGVDTGPPSQADSHEGGKSSEISGIEGRDKATSDASSDAAPHGAEPSGSRPATPPSAVMRQIDAFLQGVARGGGFQEHMGLLVGSSAPSGIAPQQREGGSGSGADSLAGWSLDLSTSRSTESSGKGGRDAGLGQQQRQSSILTSREGSFALVTAGLDGLGDAPAGGGSGRAKSQPAEAPTADTSTQAEWPRGEQGWRGHGLKRVRLSGGGEVVAARDPPPIGGPELHFGNAVTSKGGSHEPPPLPSETEASSTRAEWPIDYSVECEQRPGRSGRDDQGELSEGNPTAGPTGVAGAACAAAPSRRQLHRIGRQEHRESKAAAVPGQPAAVKSSSSRQRRPRSKTPERRPITGASHTGDPGPSPERRTTRPAIEETQEPAAGPAEQFEQLPCPGDCSDLSSRSPRQQRQDHSTRRVLDVMSLLRGASSSSSSTRGGVPHGLLRGSRGSEAGEQWRHSAGAAGTRKPVQHDGGLGPHGSKGASPYPHAGELEAKSGTSPGPEACSLLDLAETTPSKFRREQEEGHGGDGGEQQSDGQVARAAVGAIISDADGGEEGENRAEQGCGDDGGGLGSRTSFSQWGAAAGGGGGRCGKSGQRPDSPDSVELQAGGRWGGAGRMSRRAVGPAEGVRHGIRRGLSTGKSGPRAGVEVQEAIAETDLLLLRLGRMGSSASTADRPSSAGAHSSEAVARRAVRTGAMDVRASVARLRRALVASQTVPHRGRAAARQPFARSNSPPRAEVDRAWSVIRSAKRAVSELEAALDGGSKARQRLAAARNCQRGMLAQMERLASLSGRARAMGERAGARRAGAELTAQVRVLKSELQGAKRKMNALEADRSVLESEARALRAVAAAQPC